jgi:hypothetical protein
MSLSPSDLPWWGWLLCSLAAWVVCLYTSLFGKAAEGEAGGCVLSLAALASGLAGVVTGGMAVVLFVKWVWNSG